MDIVLIIIACSSLIVSLAYITKNIKDSTCCGVCKCNQFTRNDLAQNSQAIQSSQAQDVNSGSNDLMNMIQNNMNTLLSLQNQLIKPPINIQMQSPVSNNQQNENEQVINNPDNV